MRELCGVENKEFFDMKDCKHHFIADFYGCVADQKAAYIFVKEIEYFEDKFSCLPDEILEDPFERARMMLDIIELFVGLHKIKYVHGDIKPENIMSFIPYYQHKIVGFRYTNKEGGDFLGGAGGYLAPERRAKDSKLAGLTVQEDIFSLAMTLLKLEELDISVDDLIPNTCFETKDSQSKCQENVNEKVEEVFSKEDPLYSLRSVFKKALNFNPDDRYETMEKLSKAILKRLKKLEGAKKFFESIL